MYIRLHFVLLGWILASAGAAAQPQGSAGASPALPKLSAPRDANCALGPHLSKSLELDRSASDLIARHPWLKDTFTWCTGLALGTPEQQGSFISSCFAAQCKGANTCETGVRQLATMVVANAATRAQLRSKRKACESMWAAEVFRKQATAMDAFVNLQVSIATGHEMRARQLSMGSEDDFELLQALVAFHAALEAFFETSISTYGLVAAELARVQLAAMAPKPPTPLDALEWVEQGQSVTIRSPDGKVRSTFVRDEGRWKLDLDAFIRASSTINPPLLHLMAFAFEEAATYVEARRAPSPTIAANAAAQCTTVGMFFVMVSLEKAKQVCAEFIEGKLQ